MLREKGTGELNFCWKPGYAKLLTIVYTILYTPDVWKRMRLQKFRVLWTMMKHFLTQLHMNTKLSDQSQNRPTSPNWLLTYLILNQHGTGPRLTQYQYLMTEISGGTGPRSQNEHINWFRNVWDLARIIQNHLFNAWHGLYSCKHHGTGPKLCVYSMFHCIWDGNIAK